MNDLLHSLFQENEVEANKYTARCLRIIAGAMALVWGLNWIGMFIISKPLMNLSIPLAMITMLIPTLLVERTKGKGWWLKYAIMLTIVAGMTVINIMLTLHGVLAWLCPIILSCHYYSKKVSAWTVALCVVGIAVSLYLGLHVGVLDNNMVKLDADGERIVNAEVVTRVFRFYFLPRAIILLAITPVCFTIAKRTTGLLVRHANISVEKERIGAELNVATKIQASMLPCIFPAFPNRKEFDIYASMLPAKEVGGDFYDFFLIDDDKLAVVIADVSGKGVPAALFMVIAKTLLKNNAQYGKSPKEVFETVNDLLCENNEAGMFVTAFMGILDIPTGLFTYVNAGHNPPMIKRMGENCEWLPTKPGFVLAGMDGMSYKQDEITLKQGDVLFMYTDGVTEAVNRQDELFTEPRLLEVANRHKDSELRELLTNIKSEIDLFANGAEQADDITMLAVRYTGGAQ